MIANHKKCPELPALTGIRFFAAFFVFLAHITAISGMEWLDRFQLFRMASFGVVVFFVLSGFILTYNYAGVFETSVHAGDYGRFIFDRLSKIYPLYLLTLLLCIPLQLAGHHRDWSWLAVGLHLTLTQCIFPILNLKLTDQFNVPAWTISCELFFYLLAPLFIWLVFQLNRWYQFVLVVGIALPVCLFAMGMHTGSLIWVGRFAPLRVPEFILGVITGVCFIRFQSPFRTSWFFVAIGLVLIGLAFVFNEQFPLYLASPIAAPGAALLIYGLTNQQGLLARLLSNQMLVLLGASSFAFYLIHDPIIRIFKGGLQYCQLTIVGSWQTMMVTITLFVFIQTASIIVYQKVELPIQKKLRSLIRKKQPVS